MKKEKESQPEEIELKEPKELIEIIKLLYLPCKHISLSDDLLEGYEIFEAVSPYCETSKEFLFNTLIKIGFITTTIENTLYWIVKYNY